MTTKTYSIAKTRDQLAALIRQTEEQTEPVRITRRGKPVAVLLSMEEYERLLANQPKRDFWTAYLEYRERWKDVLIDEDEDIWEGVRDKTPAPDTNPWL